MYNSFMASETIINISFGAKELIILLAGIFFALLAIVWKGKSEIASTIQEELDPFKKSAGGIINAITEVQTILRDKFIGLNIVNNLVERGGSPLQPTSYGVSLIKDSGLEKILNDTKELLCVKLKASLPAEPTEYDIQEHARKLLVELKDDPMMNPVKEWVYNHPMDIEIILRVGGLWLKDDFLGQPRRVAQDE